LIVADLNRRLSDRDISIRIDEDAEKYIIEQAYDPIYGARPLKRYIQKYVETLSAKLILADKVEPGDVIRILLENKELKAIAKKEAI
jgi:ATP-dependent Clp protease ATP-binding subunit ClpB